MQWTEDSHLCYSGLLLLELTESEDASPALISELLLEGMQQLHLLPKAAHMSTHSFTCDVTVVHIFTLPLCLVCFVCFEGVCTHTHKAKGLTCTQTPVPPPAEWGRWWSLRGIQMPAAHTITKKHFHSFNCRRADAGYYRKMTNVDSELKRSWRINNRL